jgi:hypothetical protein
MITGRKNEVDNQPLYTLPLVVLRHLTTEYNFNASLKTTSPVPKKMEGLAKIYFKGQSMKKIEGGMKRIRRNGVWI